MTEAGDVDRIELELTPDGYVASALKRAADGSILWRHKAPDSGRDAFVAVEVRPEELVMTAWSGWRITADAQTGQEASRLFAK